MSEIISTQRKVSIVRSYARITAVAVLTALTPLLLAGDDSSAPAAATTAKTACCEGAAEACCATAAKAGFTKVEYQVSGMAGAACESKVKTSLAKVQGVSESSACAESSKVSVAYDATKARDKDLLAAIRKAGFKVQSETVELKVDGMTCAGCSGKVDSALGKLQGVKEQKVCHESKNAVVTFDPNKTTLDKVMATIAKTGFKVVN